MGYQILHKGPQTLIQQVGAPIWENIYYCSVRYKDSVSIDELKTFGMPTVGDAGIDHDIHNQPLYVAITINDMVEYFRKGITVTLRNNNDAERIYNVVNRYLLAWKEQIENGVNIGDAPYDDLLLLDEFAKVLYPQAKTFSAIDKPSTDLFTNLFGGKSMAGRNSLFGGTLTQPVKHKNEHDSLSKVFTQTIKGNGGYSWR